MNESRQPVPYEPHYRHDVCLLQKIKYLQKFRNISIFAGIFQIALKGQMESTSEYIARRTPSVNILITDSAITMFCRLLWVQILNL